MEHHPFLLWLFASVALVLCCFTIPSHSYTDPVDKQAMDDFYNALTNKGTSLPSVLPNDWCGGVKGVTCGTNAHWGKVITINLGESKLTGSIPSTLGNLASLQSLGLESNQLAGTIPSTLGKLTSLFDLHLYDNQLTGSIPSTLGNLASIRELYLVYNQLTGSIPSSLGNLASLRELGLNGNQLTGTIPFTLGNLASLYFLYLNENQLTGSIPSTLGNLGSLQNLGLYSNQLTGSIPSTLGNLTKLEILYLDDNQLTGSIPSTLGNLTKLKDLLLKGTNNLCPLVDYSSWAQSNHDYPGSTACNACVIFTCQHDGTCHGGENELFKCTCTSGWMGENCQESIPCNASTYYSVDEGRCLSCPPNSSSPSQSISLSSCICTQPGHYLGLPQSVCIPCPNNTYFTSQNECQACPANSTSIQASPSIDSCICMNGFSFNPTTSRCDSIPTPTRTTAQLRAGAIAGIVVGSVVGALLFIGLGAAIVVFKKGPARRQAQSFIEFNNED